MGWVVSATPRPLYPRECPGPHCIGGWVSPRADMDGCGKFRPPTGNRSPDRPARSQSLYRLSNPGPLTHSDSHVSLTDSDWFLHITVTLHHCSRMCWDESVELSATYIGGSVFPGSSPALQLVAINFTNQASLTVNSFGSWSQRGSMQTNSAGFMTTGQE